jgi:hypothetical protein
MRIDQAYTIIRSWNCEQKLTIFVPRFHDFMDNQTGHGTPNGESDWAPIRGGLSG